MLYKSSFESKCLHHSMHLPYCTDLQQRDSKMGLTQTGTTIVKRLAMQLQEELDLMSPKSSWSKHLHAISPDLQHTHSSNEDFHWSDARNQSFQSKQPFLGKLYAEHHTNHFHES
jgi:hypothetical protein